MAIDEVAVPGVIGGGDIGSPGVAGHAVLGAGNVALKGVNAGDDIMLRGDPGTREAHREMWRANRLDVLEADKGGEPGVVGVAAEIPKS